MDIICSPCGIVDIEHCGQGIMDLVQAGFSNILLDFSMACPANELEPSERKQMTAAEKKRISVIENPSALAERVKPMLEKCEKEGLRFPVARAPYLRRDTVWAKHSISAGCGWESAAVLDGEQSEKNVSVLLERLTEESIRLCHRVCCHAIVIRPLFSGVEPGEAWEVNRAYFLRLAEVAKENQVMILLENQCRSINGHLVRGICSDATEAVTWVDRLNEEAGDGRFGFCMDVGVCNLCGQNMQEFAAVLGKRLKAVILCDCDGDTENAMLPFTCASGGQSRTDWLGLIRGLRVNGFDGQMILNLSDTAASFSPILRPQLMQLAKAVAEYFQWQIGIETLIKKYPMRVLFGAGNMCRNYMKCYGEKYPPLFTCDNNRTLWGSEFCGLEVKNPASLKDLPKDCAIFICNIYYREIEGQLRDMGVENPIEFFNDEYMPSFYFDRVEDILPGRKRE